MNYELIDRIVEIISNNILTPVIYMLKHDNVLDFICFCDKKITMQDIYDTERKLSDITGKKVEILDIREFGESERLEVINNSSMIFSEHPLIEKIFTQSMMEDFRLSIEERNSVLERHRESGTCYLQ